MKYAVDYQPVGDSYAFAWEEGNEPTSITLKSGKKGGQRAGVFGNPRKKAVKIKKSAEMTTANFMAMIQEGDIIFAELAGQNDRFCIGAFRSGAELFRIPANHIHEKKKHLTTDERSNPQIDISIIYGFALSQPEKFYPFRAVEDSRYLEIRLLTRMYWTVQRKIRIATANRLRHLVQDLELIGNLEGMPIIQDGIKNVLETLPPEEYDLVESDTLETDRTDEVEIDPKKGVAVKFYKGLENRLKAAMERKLVELPLYQAVFSNFGFKAPGIAGYVISQILDIRRFPTFPKLKAFAGYHLNKRTYGKEEKFLFPPEVWMAPKPMRGRQANWDHILQQAVYYFTSVVDKQKPDNPWKQQLQRRFHYELGKLLNRARAAGEPVPNDMTVEKFIAYVEEERAKAKEAETIAKLPKPYKGMPAVARKRAMRYLGQKFLQFVWNEWRRFERLPVEDKPLFSDYRMPPSKDDVGLSDSTKYIQ